MRSHLEIKYPDTAIYFVEISYVSSGNPGKLMKYHASFEKGSRDEAFEAARAEFTRTHVEDAEIIAVRTY